MIVRRQSELYPQSPQQPRQLHPVFQESCLLVWEHCSHGALKGRNNQRVQFRAAHEMLTGYFSYALGELISRHVALEVSLKKSHYQQPFGVAPAPVGEVNGQEDSDKNRSQNDANYRVADHGLEIASAQALIPH